MLKKWLLSAMEALALIAVLVLVGWLAAEPPPWPNRPIGTSPDLAAYPFAGRVVVEVWDKSARVAVRVNRGTSAELIGHAATALATMPT
jgi:hypothetical protein